MKLTVEERGRKKRVTVKGSTLRHLYESLGYNTEEYVASLNGELLLEDDKLKEGATVKLFPVVSGG